MADFPADQLARDRYWLRFAIGISRRCQPSAAAFSVGAVIIDAAGHEMAEGYSRESDPHEHAEEAALRKLEANDPRLRQATIYSSLEPCSTRKSRPRACAGLILASGIPRVVFALREPAVFIDGRGAEILHAAGVAVVEIDDLAGQVRNVNAHLLDTGET